MQFSDLDYDVVTAIAAHVERKDLLQLALTTPVLLNVCRQQLVRAVDISVLDVRSVNRLALFCRFMLDNPERLPLIQSLKIHVYPGYPAAGKSWVFFETQLAPVLESAINIKMISLSWIEPDTPCLRQAIVSCFSRVVELGLGQGSSRLAFIHQSLSRCNPRLRRVDLTLGGRDDLVGVLSALQPCQDSLEELQVWKLPRSRRVSSLQWPLVQSLTIEGHIFGLTWLYSVFPNLQHLVLSESMESIGSGSDSPVEDIAAWSSLRTYKGRLRAFLSLGVTCRLAKLFVTESFTGLFAHLQVPILATVLARSRPRCLFMKIVDVPEYRDCSSDDMLARLCDPTLWGAAPDLESLHIEFTGEWLCDVLLLATQLSCLSLVILLPTVVSEHEFGTNVARLVDEVQACIRSGCRHCVISRLKFGLEGLESIAHTCLR